MLSVMGCRIHVIDQGTGPPVLFLHGNPDSSELWHGVIASCRHHFRCIAPDLPGYGKSQAAEGFDYSLEGQAAFVDALYSALGVSGPIKLVAHDFGGTFAAAWLSMYPEKVSHAVFSNSAFTTRYRWHFWAHVWRIPILGELSMLLMNRLMFGQELRRGSKGLTSEHIDCTYRLITRGVKTTTLRLYRAVRRHSFSLWEDRYAASAKKVPVLVLWGEDDPYIPSKIAETFNAKRIVRYPGSGHWLPVVEPQRVAAEVATFFAA